MTVRWALDHLVVGASSLAEGLAWCEAQFGLVPGAGGKHALMGTHNRVFAVASARFPRAYLEIIAIDPQAPPPGRPRWFDLDDAALQRVLAQGPALIHWVARCDDLEAELAALRAQGIDAGEALAAERETPAGLLRWRIGVRTDGRRLAAGALPTLIEWGARHPADTLPDVGVVLDAMTLAGVPAVAAQRLPGHVGCADGDSTPLEAVFSSSRGAVVLRAPRIGA